MLVVIGGCDGGRLGDVAVVVVVVVVWFLMISRKIRILRMEWKQIRTIHTALIGDLSCETKVNKNEMVLKL